MLVLRYRRDMCPSFAQTQVALSLSDGVVHRVTVYIYTGRIIMHVYVCLRNESQSCKQAAYSWSQAPFPFRLLCFGEAAPLCIYNAIGLLRLFEHLK